MIKVGRKKGITRERHIEIGGKIAEIRDEVLRLGVEVANAYPRSGNDPRVKFARALMKALAALDQVKNEGDNASCREHPKEWQPEWYYPPVLNDNELTRILRDGE